MSPRVLVVQHEDSCPPALLGEWLVGAGLSLDVRRPDRGEALPADLTTHDALVVLGGSMDADDEAGHPWLSDTVVLLRLAVDGGLPTLGVCLGHQLLARAGGGVVGRNPRGRQLGLLPMGWAAEASADRLVGTLAMMTPAASGSPARCLQWNRDIVVGVPQPAVVLAQTAAGEPQVVRFAPLAWGIQAHPEVDRALMELWVDDAADDEVDDVQHLVNEVDTHADELATTWRPVAERFAALIVSEHRRAAASSW